jgi:type I restriction enzyme S subunit
LSPEEWFGDIPMHWKVVRVGSVFRERKTTVSDKDFPPLSVTKFGVVPQLESAAKSDNSDGRKLVRKGDFVINSRSDRKGSSGLARQDGSCSVIYIVLEPTGIEPDYAEYLLKSVGFQEEFYRWGAGIVDDLWSTRYSAMKQIRIPLPPRDEQRKISEWLAARQTTYIQTNSKAEAVRKLVLERKKAYARDNLAHRPDSALGITYPPVPLGRIARLVARKGEAEPFVGLENIESNTGRILPAKVSEGPIRGEGEPAKGVSIARAGDVLFGRLRPYLAKVAVVEEDCSLGGDILVFQPLRCSSEFLKLLLLSPDFLSHAEAVSTGTKMPRCSWDNLKTFKFFLPPAPVQDKLVAEFKAEDALAVAIYDSLKTVEGLNLERGRAESALVATGKMEL